MVYRVAEMLEGRRAQFVDEVSAGEGLTARRSATRWSRPASTGWVWYAGWADKIAQLVGNTNPVAGPYFDFSVPEPTGVVAVTAPQDSSLLGLVSVLAPAIVTGNSTVVVASEATAAARDHAHRGAGHVRRAGRSRQRAHRRAHRGRALAGLHMDVNAIDLAGVTDAETARDLEVAAADNLKRVLRPRQESWTEIPDISRMVWGLETKTVWHPIGV